MARRDIDEVAREATGTENATCPRCGKSFVLVGMTVTGILHKNRRTGTTYGTPTLGIVPHNAHLACNNGGCGWEGRMSDLADGENQN